MIDTFPNIIAFSILGALLLLGTFLRTRVPLLQKGLLPASLIGGLIGLLALSIFDDSPVSEYNFSSFTFHFFTLSFMSLCLTQGKPRASQGSSLARGGLWLTLIWTMSLALQTLLGLAVIFLLNAALSGNTSEFLGMISAHGFTQGPGQALTIGGIWETEFGIDNAANVGLIYASVGFAVAFAVGIPAASWVVRRGLNANRSASINGDFLRGMYATDNAETTGRHVTHPSNVDTFAFHLSILGVAYIITHLWLSMMQAVIGDAQPFGIRLDVLFSHNLFFVHGLIVCLLIRSLLNHTGHGSLIDDGTQQRITGTAVDFMVVAMLLSIKISVLAEFLLPIILVSVVVAATTALLCFVFARRMKELGPERALTIFGCCTGSTGSGLLVLRVLDPDFSTSVSKELAFFNVAIIITTFHIWAIVAPILPSLSFGWILLIYGVTLLLSALVIQLIQIDAPRKPTDDN